MAAMSGRSLGVSALAALTILFAHLGPAASENTAVVATVDKPAVVTAVASPSGSSRPADQPAQVIVTVTGYKPPSGEKPPALAAVVKVQGNGAEPDREIGRFGIFPNTAFTQADQARRYAFPLPKDLSNRDALMLSVQLEPFRGSTNASGNDARGEDARLEVGGAKIE